MALWRALVLVVCVLLGGAHSLRLRVCVSTHDLHQTHRPRLNQLLFDRISKVAASADATRIRVHVDRRSARECVTHLRMSQKAALVANITMSTPTLQDAVDAIHWSLYSHATPLLNKV